MSVEPDCREADTPGRNLDLPLVDDRDSGLWAGPEVAQRDRHVWPTLTDALSESGRRMLWEALREAVDATPGDPDRALMVVEAFWRTMVIRRGPNYERDVWGDVPSQRYSLDELRREVEGHVSSA
jgi:hypothetical protein